MFLSRVVSRKQQTAQEVGYWPDPGVEGDLSGEQL
jgi:hypothetical protein